MVVNKCGEVELMSSIEKEGFAIEENSDGSFFVKMDGKNFRVETKEEARCLSMLPVELNNTLTSTLENPNVELIKKIITLCDEYDIYSLAVRRLKAYVTRITQ